jgi:hypothetical protein
MSAEMNIPVAVARMAISEMFYAARCMPDWHPFRFIHNAIGIPPRLKQLTRSGALYFGDCDSNARRRVVTETKPFLLLNHA